MKNILQNINRIYPLSAEALQLLTQQLTAERHPKGHALFKAGRVEHKMYFIEQGIVRAYCFRDEKEITFWFGTEGDVVFSVNNYIAGKPGYEHIELLEDSVLHSITYNDIQHLFKTNLELANWGRKVAEYELVRTEECFIGLQFQPAAERYKNLLQSNPQLIRRVQLGHIASYLGVTQVTLSRIRAEIR